MLFLAVVSKEHFFIPLTLLTDRPLLFALTLLVFRLFSDFDIIDIVLSDHGFDPPHVSITPQHFLERVELSERKHDKPTSRNQFQFSSSLVTPTKCISPRSFLLSSRLHQ